MMIDIGGGHTPAPGHVNLDPEHGEGEWKRYLQDGIPVDDGTVAEVRAFHVLEHIPAGMVRVQCMNEIWRALRTGGLLKVGVPVLLSQDGAVHWEAIADPTHVSFWCYESFLYFTGERFAQANYDLKLYQQMGYVENGGVAECVLMKP